MTAVRDQVLAALEKACRENVNAYQRIMEYVTADRYAVRYGAVVPRIMFLTGMKSARVRYQLRSLRDLGLVLEDPPSRPYGMSSYWPVGLWEKLQQERAAQKLCTTCQGEGVIHTGILEAPVTQCRKCDGDGLEGGAK